jgi:hypothetical protein
MARNNMLTWVWGIESVIAVGVILLISSTRIAKRRPPSRIYFLGAVAGLLAWGCSIVNQGSEHYNDSPLTTIWTVWTALLPLTLPILAGLSGWIGARPPWRWIWLSAGIVAAIGSLLGGVYM